jgi:hypothetical protein
MTSQDSRTGTVVLCQQGLTPIDDGQVLDALPDAVRSGRREHVAIDLREANERSIASRDWHEAGRVLAEAYSTRVKPALEPNAGSRVAYFGTVSVPLALQLGYHLGTWRGADAFLHHHGRKDWKWPAGGSPAAAVEVRTTGMPIEGSTANGDLVIRVSTSHRIHPSQTQEVVPRWLAQVDIALDTPGEDALQSPQDVEAVAVAFKRALDRLHDLFPNAERIHLFAAVQVGVAFLMGTRVSQTIHPPVQTYQFDSKADPKYHAALCLQREAEPRTLISDQERAAAALERAAWAEELGRLKAFAASLPESGSWLDDLLPSASASRFGTAWLGLPNLRSVAAICDSGIDLRATKAAGGFGYSAADRRWTLGDEFLVPLIRRIDEEADRRRAGRLFLLHEGLHVHQGLTASTSPEIGRFAKVLEDIDYQADVWSLLHERKLAQTTTPQVAQDDPILVRSLIKLAVETMLSFDDAPGPTNVMQVRRVSRYLIWSWQYLETERSRRGDDVAAVLATKPMIELAGPEIRARENRVWYLLDVPRTHTPEVALYRDHRLHRFSAGPSSQHEEILEAVRTRDGERLRRGLRGVFDLVVPAARRQ